jgi:hypothetical protein
MIRIEHVGTISRWVRNQLKCIDFVVDIDQEGVSLDLHLQQV